ncbi:AP-4 complex subunit mu-1 isoform X2 [Lingula anatina]|uniref:AP-4 complex subunit mu-1 isoform X2 n=1 Tax=Lingula anatina TaxID=7574 RepID=A0A1S3JC35_LINAN|nr:AP-4 complex subunit mu-1 isoform X2 [Lingula anatina]|eukprot:XP_013407888.1 AP-4 complex subunit mu-1 isoform X2 [Lingula anatina]
MLSECILISSKGEVLVDKQFRQDVCKSSSGGFIAKVKGDSAARIPPHFMEGDIHYYYIKRSGVYFVATTKGTEVSSILVIEILSRVYHLCKDFCGVINTDTIKANMVLIYELLGEVLDFGYAQLMSASKLKPYVQSEPVLVKSEGTQDVMVPGLFGLERRVAPSHAADKPVIRSRQDQEKRNNEIFVDIVERVTAVVDADGSLSRAEVSGQVNMKSFLAGAPVIKMGLSEDLTITKGKQKGYNKVQMDDCSFHPSIDLKEFDNNRVLGIKPTEGELVVMTYHIGGENLINLPFRLTHRIEFSSTRNLELHLKLRCELAPSAHAVNVGLKIHVPRETGRITQQFSCPGQSAILKQEEKCMLWQIKRIEGGSEAASRFMLISQDKKLLNSEEVGPATLDFELSNHVCSGLKVRFLRVFEREHSYLPQRWIRYITVPDNYLFKLATTE